jgi:hypothetical protein
LLLFTSVSNTAPAHLVIRKASAAQTKFVASSVEGSRNPSLSNDQLALFKLAVTIFVGFSVYLISLNSLAKLRDERAYSCGIRVSSGKSNRGYGRPIYGS